MSVEAVRHSGIIETFVLESPDWPVITPRAKGTVRSSNDGAVYILRGIDFLKWEHLLPLVGVRISFVLVRWTDGTITASDVRLESAA
ncbi:hypothetical protein [Pseudomonas violetae]|uniref:Uncharacterized protein n=1 Tax=Pseudomonas violetae TaxID=2915813 RepID=A0ABT0F8J4_9PSED|nr:hypothetical protein [Pseudomonas violetae]MCK1793944.1 hypothetical protein [Pseudomonas violetae]